MAPRSCEPEEAVENHMRREVQRKLKGRFYKLIPGLSKGIPDRLVLLPGGRIFLVELKAEDGEVEPIQEVWHGQAAELGTEVVVLVGRADVDRWIKAQMDPWPKLAKNMVINWETGRVTLDGQPFPFYIEADGPLPGEEPRQTREPALWVVDVPLLVEGLTEIGERP